VDVVHAVVVEPRVVVVEGEHRQVGVFMSGSPGGLAMPCATSMRNPSTPRSSQNRSVFSRSSKISGFSS